jgi:hypothetical protein
MSFLYPSVLFGLLAIAIPIIVHLFSFRRYKTIFFSQTKFLQQVKMQHASKNNLRHLLILLFRCLAVAAIVLAFAGPFVSSSSNASITQSRVYSIFLDNSLSMQGEGTEGQRFQTAKTSARNLVRELPPDAKIQLLTNNLEGFSRFPLSKEEALDRVDEIEFSANSADITAILGLQKAFFSQELNAAAAGTAFLISDFQTNQFSVENQWIDTLNNYRLIEINPVLIPNISVDSIYFDSPFLQPGNAYPLHVVLTNHSGQLVEDVMVNMEIKNGSNLSFPVSINPFSSADSLVKVFFNQTGFNPITVSINDNALTFDNKIFGSAQVGSTVNIIEIFEGEPEITFTALFGDEPWFNLNQMPAKQVNQSALQSANFIILNGVNQIETSLQRFLVNFVESGGTLLAIPKTENDNSFAQVLQGFGVLVEPYQATETRGASIETNHPLLSNLFEKVPQNINLPKSKGYFPTKGSFTTIISLEQNTPLLGQVNDRAGNVFFFTIPSNSAQSNLKRHGVFAGVVLKMAEFSVPNSPLFFSPESSESLSVLDAQRTGKVQVKHTQSNVEYVLPIEVFGQDRVVSPGRYLSEPGFYEILNDSENVIFALNRSLTESNDEYLNAEELENQLKLSGASRVSSISASNLKSAGIKDFVEGKQTLWRYFVGLALFFLLLEMLLPLFFRNNQSA